MNVRLRRHPGHNVSEQNVLRVLSLNNVSVLRYCVLNATWMKNIISALVTTFKTSLNFASIYLIFQSNQVLSKLSN